MSRCPCPSKITRLNATFPLVLLILFWSAVPASAQTGALPPDPTNAIVQVKLKEGLKRSQIDTVFPPELRDEVTAIRPLFTSSAQYLDKIKADGERRSRKKLKNLGLWFEVTLRPGTDVEAFLGALRKINQVEHAEQMPLPAPVPAATPSMMLFQGYLYQAAEGIDAEYSWTIPGGNGAGVTIYDIEYGWNPQHEDLSRAANVTMLMNPFDQAIDPYEPGVFNHGTAVLGVLVADYDGKGVTGISWGADVGMAPANTRWLLYNPANAINLILADGKPGDVILIEQQTTVCGLAYGPLEWRQSVFDAIQTATALGFIVVEAAGNGSVNLDHSWCLGRFDRNVRDSGAIIVGAGLPPGASDRGRAGFSSFGSRVDLQGWGYSVTTAGYGNSYTNADDPTNRNYWYTTSFNGTSSASPIVAGAIANLQGIALAHGMPLFTSATVRELLVETGSPQMGFINEKIGPRPNLAAAIARILPDHADSTAPECEIAESVKNSHIKVRVQDPLSGLKEVRVVKSTNSTVLIDPFTPGSNAEIFVTATKIQPKKTSVLELEVTDLAGNITRCDPVLTTLTAEVPATFSLDGNYPNPFNPSTTIRFQIAEPSHVRLTVYDVMGRTVANLVDQEMAAGSYAAEWDGRSDAGAVVAGGIYFYRIEAGAFVETRAMSLVK